MSAIEKERSRAGPADVANAFERSVVGAAAVDAVVVASLVARLASISSETALAVAVVGMSAKEARVSQY